MENCRDIFDCNFAKAFNRLLQQSQLSCYKIYTFTGIDQGYLSRLSNGGKTNPNPETILKISLALCHYSSKVTLDDIEGLFASVGRSFAFPRTERGASTPQATTVGDLPSS